MSVAAHRPVYKTAAYTAVPGDLVRCDATGGAFAITIPSASNLIGQQSIIVVKIDSSANAVTLTATISGSSNPTLSSQWSSMTIESTGTELVKVAST